MGPNSNNKSKMSAGPVLENKKWKIENVDGNQELKVEVTEVGQSVYAYNVNNSVIQVSAKVTAITLDKCQGTGIVFKGAVASFDVVNSKKVQVQLSVDKSEGVKVFINESAKANSSFITAHAQEVL